MKRVKSFWWRMIMVGWFSLVQGRLVLNDFSTPLHWAVKQCFSVKEVEELIEKDNDLLNAQDIQLRTPLHWAALLARDEAVEVLVLKGAEVNAQDFQGNTPLHLVAAHTPDPLKRIKIIIFLVRHGANIYLRNIYSYSAIDVAIPFDFRRLILRLSENDTF
jgi:uncharacterized protein